MTLVSDIIRRSYRTSDIIPLGATPNAAQIAEALDFLNGIILSSVGNEVGDELRELNYGGSYDQSDFASPWLPDNCRVIFNLNDSVTLFADPYPYEGQRLAFIAVAESLAGYAVIIDGNGREIEGTSSITLTTDSDPHQWMYRSDSGNWVKIEALISADDMPLPEEFDDYFVKMLAMQIDPLYGQAMAGESLKALQRMRSQIRARYTRKNYSAPTDPGLVNYRDQYRYSSGSNDFNLGRPSPWR